MSARALGCVLATLALSAPPAARGQVFSPGELSRPHAHLEGLAACTRCHVAGERLSGARCLDCHVELRGRVEAGRGYHGRIPADERACERCHREHLGRDFALVDWGERGRAAFDHARTGYALRGRHRGVDCARCHDPRLVADPAVKALLAREPRRRTLLGAPQACASCHFDEHRGQVGDDCARCHDEQGWKPARGFVHAKARYPLEGAHARVACARCHPSVDAPAPGDVGPLTPPKAPLAAVRYRGMAFGACADCHKDPHQGRFGGSCQSCHTVADWRKLTAGGAERAFHEKTRYPLRGAHAAVACAACHPPGRGGKATWRGVAFARCTDCHVDGHVGQLARVAPPAGPPAATCDRCHGVEAYAPARFEAEDHDRLEYRLEGAHRAVACSRCHPPDPKLAARVPAADRARLARQGREPRVSLAVYDVPRASDCRTCHEDPHRGQLDSRIAKDGCAGCHSVESFRKVRFDHAGESRFPLRGRHATAACGACHRAAGNGPVRYRPLPVACAGCHADVHAGQLGGADGATDCGRCHGEEGWKAPAPLRFAHAPPFTTYRLEGRHRQVACARCHAAVPVAEGAAVTRYRPLPRACEACHADFHRGAFRGFRP